MNLMQFHYFCTIHRMDQSVDFPFQQELNCKLACLGDSIFVVHYVKNNKSRQTLSFVDEAEMKICEFAGTGEILDEFNVDKITFHDSNGILMIISSISHYPHFAFYSFERRKIYRENSNGFVKCHETNFHEDLNPSVKETLFVVYQENRKLNT